MAETIHVEEAGQTLQRPISTEDNPKEVFSTTYTTVSEDVGKIADVGAAQELANIENKQGRNAALAREKELQAQAESPISSNEEQREYEKLMDMLTFKEGKEINKNAFIDKTDGKGRRYRILHVVHPRTNDQELKDNGYPGKLIFFSRNGVAIMNLAGVEGFLPGMADFDQITEKINWTLLGDMMEDPNRIPPNPNNYPTHLNIETAKGEHSMNSEITKFELKYPEVKTALAVAIQLSEKMGLSKKERAASHVVRATDIADGLV